MWLSSTLDASADHTKQTSKTAGCLLPNKDGVSSSGSPSQCSRRTSLAADLLQARCRTLCMEEVRLEASCRAQMSSPPDHHHAR